MKQAFLQVIISLLFIASAHSISSADQENLLDIKYYCSGDEKIFTGKGKEPDIKKIEFVKSLSSQHQSEQFTTKTLLSTIAKTVLNDPNRPANKTFFRICFLYTYKQEQHLDAIHDLEWCSDNLEELDYTISTEYKDTIENPTIICIFKDKEKE